MTRLTIEQWIEEGTRRFGPKVDSWKFTCPSCGHVQTRQDFLELGLPKPQVDIYLAFSCIGRFRLTDDDAEVVEAFEFDRGSGCKYIGGSTSNISPIELETGPKEIRPTFGFMPEDK